ncbi:glycoside hydrolase family 25 protein [Actinacidiphila acididurans]|uniref:Lysozyme n=1 Tax=Actinacidiphila acididurans TaxID=2784346 RepID=A0ABS2U4C1_9ACTN|nr:GH25 family lysozyme [Actinacidiphila acididurans]MBM9510001.1 hypothetical protein [Actinacidiphila acididurans]
MTGSQGQDWASYQDWSPSTAGLAFVLIKATEGGGYVNPRYTSQLAAARAGNVVPGHYHFARPGGMQAQADFFLRKISLKPGDVLALDWEDTGVSSADKDAWIKYVQAKAPAHQVLLYCNRDFWLNRDHSSFAGDGLWIADPDAPAGHPRIQHAWVLHQYSEAGGIDRDYSPLSAADFAAWTHAKENDMAITDADVQKLTAALVPAVRDAILNYLEDDPTTSDNSTKRLAAILWDMGKNAAQANSWAQKVSGQVAQAAAPVLADAQVGQIAAALASNTAFINGIADRVTTDLAARLQN